MAENTKIEWAHHTFNPWTGCTKIGPGCDHCYAESWAKRSGIVQWGPGAERRRTSEANWRQPIKWNAEAERLGVRYRVFCASLADVFDNKVPPEWRRDLFDLIAKTPNLDWLLVTKRIGNAKTMMADALHLNPTALSNGQIWPLPNVWLGITVVNQAEADRDIPKLLAVPARVRFLSIEPMLGPIDVRRFMWPVHPRWPAGFGSPEAAIAAGAKVTYHRQGLISAKWADHLLSWVICGGESGPGARPMHIPWARSLMQQCKAAGVAFHMKQLGAQPRGWCVGQLHMEAEDRADVEDDFCDGYEAHEFGRSCGRCVLLADRKGGDMAEWPEDLRVREFPSA